MTQRFLAGVAEKGATSLDNMVRGKRGAAGISVPFKKILHFIIGIKFAPASIPAHMNCHWAVRQRRKIMVEKHDLLPTPT